MDISAIEQYVQATQQTDETIYNNAHRANATPEDKALYERRMYRRTIEMQNLEHILPPGKWDADMDKHPEKEYTIDIGDGYVGFMRRNMFYSWNGYVTLPINHTCIGMHYLDLIAKGDPYPPVELSYSHHATFGFNHAHDYDCLPYKSQYRSYCNEYWGEGYYFTYEDVLNEIMQLKAHFQTVCILDIPEREETLHNND